MSEVSYFWNGLSQGDAYRNSPYNTDTMALLEGVHSLQFGDKAGVIGGYANNLAVTASAWQASLNTGAAIVNGRIYISNASVVFPLSVSGVWLIGLRYDVAGQTIRAVAKGPYNSELAATYAIVQSSSIWEMPLATVNIQLPLGTPIVADKRAYVLRRATERIFIQSVSGYNVTDGTGIVRNSDLGVTLPNNKNAYAFGSILVSEKFLKSTSTATLYGVGKTTLTLAEDVYVTNLVNYGVIGGAYNTYTNGAPALGVVSLYLDTFTIVSTDVLANMTPGANLLLRFQRDATNVNDTLNSSLYFSGWFLDYSII